MYDLIIIGGGPAGLTAAIYAIRKRLDCLLISPDLGGKANARMLVEGLDTYQVINGADIVRRFRSEIEYLDFARSLEKVTHLERSSAGFSVTTDRGHVFDARAVILATGADPVRLSVPGADRFFLRGISYSAVSYAPLYVDKRVALIGTNSRALRAAAELSHIVNHLYLISPEPADVDHPLGRRVLASSKVTLLDRWQPVAVEGDTFARRLEVQGPSGETRALDIDVIFVELGLRPHSELVQGMAEVDDEQRVVVNCGAGTSVPGLFAAGDVTQLPAEQVLIAIGEGAKAALDAYEYLLGRE